MRVVSREELGETESRRIRPAASSTNTCTWRIRRRAGCWTKRMDRRLQRVKRECCRSTQLARGHTRSAERRQSQVVTVQPMHRAGLRLLRHILLLLSLGRPRTCARTTRPRPCVSMGGGGAVAKTAAAAASASISDRETSVRTTEGKAFANTSGQGARVKTVVEAASSSTSGGGALAKTAAAVASVSTGA